jgi:Protein of unknown function (DUF983)
VSICGPVTMATALQRGFVGKCPCCGRGRLFERFLQVARECDVCGEPFYHHRADYLPAYLVLLAAASGESRSRIRPNKAERKHYPRQAKAQRRDARQTKSGGLRLALRAAARSAESRRWRRFRSKGSGNRRSIADNSSELPDFRRTKVRSIFDGLVKLSSCANHLSDPAFASERDDLRRRNGRKSRCDATAIRSDSDSQTQPGRPNISRWS